MAELVRDALGHKERLGRERFFILGVTLFVLKFMIDRLVARLIFGRGWSPLNYLIPNETYTLLSLPPAERFFYLTMVSVAMPFVAIGILLTLRRLRDAGLPRGSVVLFFMPGVNLLFFAMLSILGSVENPVREIPPAIPASAEEQAERILDYGRDDARGSRKLLGWMLPSDPRRSMIVAALLTTPVALVMTLLSVSMLENYGWGLFVGMPFVLGMIAALLHGYHAPRSKAQCIGAGCLAMLFSACGMIVFAIEGIGCLIMLLPLAFPIAIAGALVGHAIQTRPERDNGIPNVLWAMLLALPILIGAESLIHRQPTVFSVTTSVEIAAPPSRVWKHVVAFSPIAPPTELIFRSGVAYPVQAHIVGKGVGAVRYCEFSTGAFVEPIEIWDEPRLLRFAVTDNPPPMRELSPFKIHPPHLHNFLVAHQGQFRLIELPNGHTLLEGTTWYEHGMWPQTYWRWWSDLIIHHIHTRVLEHVKIESESEA